MNKIIDDETDRIMDQILYKIVGVGNYSYRKKWVTHVDKYV